MKYIIKFKKEGGLRYISHLDMQNMFVKLFRIIGVKPRYSNGFNPHPKMGFALPLSLGFLSEAEYLEMETESVTGFKINEVMENLKKLSPEGLSIVFIRKKPDNLNKKLASYLDSAEYFINCQLTGVENSIFFDFEKRLCDYMEQGKIIYKKVSRKSDKIKEIDIKPSILKLESSEVNNNIIRLTAILHAGSDSVLNPKTLTESLFNYFEVYPESVVSQYTRKRVFCKVNGRISDIDDFI